MYNVQCRVYIVFILVYYISANSQVSFRMILKIREVINLFNVITVTFNLFNVISVTFTFIETWILPMTVLFAIGAYAVLAIVFYNNEE